MGKPMDDKLRSHFSRFTHGIDGMYDLIHKSEEHERKEYENKFIESYRGTKKYNRNDYIKKLNYFIKLIESATESFDKNDLKGR